MWDDIFDYTDNVWYWKSLIDGVLADIGELDLDTNKSVTFAPKEYIVFNNDSFATFRLKKEDSADIVIMIMDTELRIDIEDMSEMRIFFIEEVKENEKALKEELTLLFTSKIRIEYYCGDYIKIILLDSEDKPVKVYKYVRALFVGLYFWLCEPEVEKFNPMFENTLKKLYNSL